MKKYSMVVLLCMVLGLSACGTLQKIGGNDNSALDFDKKCVQNPYLWMYSLGIVPIFCAVSMPISAVDDLVNPPR